MTFILLFILLIVFKQPIMAILGTSAASLGVTKEDVTKGKDISDEMFK